MRQPRHILIIDYVSDARDDLTFLLKLSGYDVTAVRDEQEAINWVASLYQSDHPVDGLVINNFLSYIKISRIIHDLKKLGIDIPLLIVDRVGNIRQHCGHGNLNSITAVIDVCAPDNLTNRLRHLLDDPASSKQTITIKPVARSLTGNI